LGFVLDETVRERVIAETRGNPLALIELPRGLAPTQLAGGLGLIEAQAVPERIEDTFAGRLQTLSENARRLLLLAATEPLGDPRLLLRACHEREITPSAVSMEMDGLLTIGARVAFRHPLVRSAVYRSATVQERREAHRALAQATDREADPDRRAWHLAAAAAGPDEEVVAELEHSAGRAQARGGLAASAAFLERAVALTRDLVRRPERALAAAQASFQAGAFEAAVGLLATAEAGSLDEFQRARAELLRGQIAFASGSTSDTPSMFLKAANQLEPFDPALARETYLTAWGATTVTGQVDVVPEIWRNVRALPLPDTPSPLDLLLDGLALLATEGRAAAAPSLKRAAGLLAEIPVEDVLRWGWIATGASCAVWDDEGFYSISVRQVRLARDAGAFAQLPHYLSQLGIARAWMGDFEGAASLIAETESVGALTRASFPRYAMLLLRALQGREAEAFTAISSALEQAATGARSMASHAHRAAAVLFNGLARYEKAASSARRAAANEFDLWSAMWALPELIEAAVRDEDTETAHDALERLAETTQPSGTNWALGIEARCRALLRDGAAAGELYREAIERLSRTRLRPELARAHLLYGEWLRRENRRADARAQLRAAYEQFTSIGMEAFGERARMELLATGEKVRRRTVKTPDDLTAQERHIARLAQDGLSNAEIGTRLFLSPRTIEWHLRKVFTKLGVRSRRELTWALRSSDSDAAPM
jgi:DNA-binding CsgD family transcriptional regulator